MPTTGLPSYALRRLSNESRMPAMPFDDGAGLALYAGGSFLGAGGVTVNRIARWNGSSWSALGSGVNANGIRALGALGSSLYAVGDFSTAGGAPATRIARWDGSSWGTRSMPGETMRSRAAP